MLYAIGNRVWYDTDGDGLLETGEHGADGTRILTLMEVAQRFQHEQAKIVQLRQAGERTRYMETMYVLDLPLDQRTAPIPTKPVPWNRFAATLADMKLS